MDCFYVGRLQGVKGTVWQYTAIDVASSYTWAELWTTPRNPAALRTSRLARRVAEDLSARGWKLQAVMSDNASEFRSKVFRNTIGTLGAEHRFIRAGRPQQRTCVYIWGVPVGMALNEHAPLFRWWLSSRVPPHRFSVWVVSLDRSSRN